MFPNYSPHPLQVRPNPGEARVQGQGRVRVQDQPCLTHRQGGETGRKILKAVRLDKEKQRITRAVKLMIQRNYQSSEVNDTKKLIHG